MVKWDEDNDGILRITLEPGEQIPTAVEIVLISRWGGYSKLQLLIRRKYRKWKESKDA
jgi:hypothetical protein